MVKVVKTTTERVVIQMTIKEVFEKAKEKGMEDYEVCICDGYGIKTVQEVDYGEDFVQCIVLYNNDDTD